MLYKPMSSGSGSESGNCAEISCLSDDTRYLLGWTSPGSVSGNWNTDFGLSHGFRERCHAELSISLKRVNTEKFDSGDLKPGSDEAIDSIVVDLLSLSVQHQILRDILSDQ